MFRTLLVIAILPLTVDGASADHIPIEWPENFCTDSVGARVEMGETICLTVDHRSFLAHCVMVLNNPAWKDTGQTCEPPEEEPDSEEK